MTLTRTSKGDTFLARFGELGAAGLLGDPEAQHLVKEYRSRYPKTAEYLTDEDVIERIATYLAGCRRQLPS